MNFDLQEGTRAIRVIWPEILAFAGAVAYFCVILKTKLVLHELTRLRVLSMLGFVVTASLVLLGALWPSLYTIIAIPVIPALFVFGVAIFRPLLVGKRRKLHFYLNLSVLVSGVAWAFQMLWELRS